MEHLCHQSITVSRNSAVDNYTGNAPDNLATLYSVNCRVRVASADEIQKEGGVLGVRHYSIFVPREIDIKRDDKITYNTETLQVLGVRYVYFGDSTPHHTMVTAYLVNV